MSGMSGSVISIALFIFSNAKSHFRGHTNLLVDMYLDCPVDQNGPMDPPFTNSILVNFSEGTGHRLYLQPTG